MDNANSSKAPRRIFNESCAQCSKPAPERAPYYFRREFCSPECLAEFKRPVPGKAATYQIGSDSYGMTIVSVSPSGAKLGVRNDAPRPGGLHVPAEHAEIRLAFRNRDGSYSIGRCGRLYIGVRITSLDPGF